MIKWLKKEIQDYKILLRNVPALPLCFFIVSLIMMNLLANKTIVDVDRVIALDAGIIVSWLSFMSMDILTKHFGPRASTKVSIFATFINLLVCGIFYIASILPNPTGFVHDDLFKGTWFVLVGSTVAFIASAFINNFINWGIGTMFKKHPDGRAAYVTRTYISTALGQFFDNLIFAVIVFIGFAPKYWGFSWDIVQCITCSLTGAIIELIFEIIFSPIGFRITQKWKKQRIGQEYLDYIDAERVDGKCVNTFNH